MMSVMAKNGVWKNVTTSFNNWRGAQGSYYNWNTGGFHFYNAHDQTISGLVTAYNQTHGVHWDTDAQNVTVPTWLQPRTWPSVRSSKRAKGLSPSRTVTCAATTWA